MKRWTVVIERSVTRELERLPKDIIELFVQFRQDLQEGGPFPHGWNVIPLSGEKNRKNKVHRAVLKRSHRVIFQVIDPTIIVLAVVHRKDAYE